MAGAVAHFGRGCWGWHLGLKSYRRQLGCSCVRDMSCVLGQLIMADGLWQMVLGGCAWALILLPQAARLHLMAEGVGCGTWA